MSRVSYNSIHFWLYIPEGSLRSIGEGLSPTGMPLLPHPHLLMHTQIRCSCKVLAITCASGLPAIDQRFSWPPNKLGSVNFLEWLTELREIFYWLDYFFKKIKGCNSGTASWKRQGKVMILTQHLSLSFLEKISSWWSGTLDRWGGKKERHCWSKCIKSF